MKTKPQCRSLRNRSDGTLYCPHCGMSWDAGEDKPKCPCDLAEGKKKGSSK